MSHVTFKRNLSLAEVELLIEAPTGELLVSGLDANDEPNLRGLEIEKLIDYFNRTKMSTQHR